ncbi:MAG: biotin/lipoyl-containing protein [Acidimicrobiales bacterium]|nr:biotin/lipoyl-containing protein [Acidimicrobiales bacterium]
MTECVTGLDLVELQLRVAAGEPLPITQDDVSFDGHAIEVRLVAEDPTAGWLPSTGTIDVFEIGEGVRVDTGVRSGSVVSPDYDSLLAKVIGHATTREHASRRLARALRTSWVAGVHTDANALVAILGDADFLAADTPTSFLTEHPELTEATGPGGADRTALLLGAVFSREHRNRAADPVTGFAPSGWRNLRTRGQRERWAAPGDETQHVEYERRGDGASVLLGPWPCPTEDGSLSTDERQRVEVRFGDRRPDRQVLEIDGIRHVVDVWSDDHVVHVRSPAGAATFEMEPRFVPPSAAAATGGPTSPLPGKVLSVHVAAGATVSDGDVLVVVEAMKMEHAITAPGDAVVEEVCFAEGDRVDAGDLLVRLEVPE